MTAGKLYTALIIDDDPIQREVLSSWLRKRNVATILIAADGNEAKKQIAAYGAGLDLILSDLNMPNFDGIEFLMFLADEQLAAALIFITGAPAPVANAADKLASIYKVNYLGLLKKPVDFAALEAILAKLPV